VRFYQSGAVPCRLWSLRSLASSAGPAMRLSLPGQVRYYGLER